MSSSSQTPSPDVSSAGRPRSEEAHRAILDATLELLIESGYSALTVEGIANRAGVGKATIYRRWASKLPLVIEAFGRLPGLEEADTGDLVSDLERMLRSYLEVFSSTPLGAVVPSLAGELPHNPELMELFAPVVRARRQPLIRALERGVARGEIPAGTDLDLAADLIVGPITVRLFFSRAKLGPKLVPQIVRLALDGIRATGGIEVVKRTLALVFAAALLGGCTSFKRAAYEGSSRDRWQQPERVIAALAIRPGDRVADLGAGSGYFTERLARAVGPAGKVYAVDVDEPMTEYLRKRLESAGIDNVEVILARYDDPLLPDSSVDLVLVVDTYHHLEERPAYFRSLQRDLAPGGRVAVIDFDGRRGWFVRWAGHITPREDLLREMAEAGYQVAEEFDFIDRQSFVIFRPTR